MRAASLKDGQLYGWRRTPSARPRLVRLIATEVRTGHAKGKVYRCRTVVKHADTGEITNGPTQFFTFARNLLPVAAVDAYEAQEKERRAEAQRELERERDATAIADRIAEPFVQLLNDVRVELYSANDENTQFQIVLPPLTLAQLYRISDAIQKGVSK